MDCIRRIGFVCLGNIGRSPLAEHLFRHLARQKGVDACYETTSAGTSIQCIGYPYDEHLLREFAPQGGKFASIPDPYQQGLEKYEEVYEMNARSVRGL
jgi:protein-tyrosine-phosphatase